MSSRPLPRHWAAIRSRHLRRFPSCATCGAPGAAVDHVTPRHEGGSDSAANLQTLCSTCHHRKTATEQARYGRDRVRQQIRPPEGHPAYAHDDAAQAEYIKRQTEKLVDERRTRSRRGDRR